jgi:toxin ParE1/3/4
VGRRRLIISTRARADLRTITRYIAKDAPQRAESFAQRLLEQATKVAEFPYSGRQVPEFDESEVREVILAPIRIFYQVRTDDTVIILRFWHSARDKPTL